MYHQAANNPFLSYSSADSDAFLAYDHSQASLSDQIHNELFLCNQEIPEDLVQTLLAQLDSNGYFKKIDTVTRILKRKSNKLFISSKGLNPMVVLVEV